MKPWKRHSFTGCFVMILFLLICSLPGISAANDKTRIRKNNCLKCCWSKYQVCNNVNANRMACAGAYESCCATCDAEGDSPSEWSDCWTLVKDKEDEP